MQAFQEWEAPLPQTLKILTAQLNNVKNISPEV